MARRSTGDRARYGRYSGGPDPLAPPVDLAEALEIQAIPTIMAFRDGVLVYRNAGATNASGLDKLIEAVGSDELGEEVARAKAEAAAERETAGSSESQ